jgi:hypothetical protein
VGAKLLGGGRGRHGGGRGHAVEPKLGNVAAAWTLVHRGSIVAVLETFALPFFSAASARRQWKSPFPLAVILEPQVEIAFPLAVFLRNRQ